MSQPNIKMLELELQQVKLQVQIEADKHHHMLTYHSFTRRTYNSLTFRTYNSLTLHYAYAEEKKS